MSILSGYKKVKDRILTSDGYKLLSRWTSSNSVECDDGMTIQEKVGDIKGIVTNYSDITTTTDNSYIPSTTAVRDGLSQKMDKSGGVMTGLLSFRNSTDHTPIIGFDSVSYGSLIIDYCYGVFRIYRYMNGGYTMLLNINQQGTITDCNGNKLVSANCFSYSGGNLNINI